jgi:AcrR family transcriptional regulator
MRQVHKSAPQRRRDFVDAAIAVMQRKGLLETTSRDIAAQARVSVGLLHHYFDSHDALLAEAFEEVATADLERVQRDVAQVDDPAERLNLLVEVFAPADDDWQYQVWLDVWSAAAHHPALLDASRQVNDRWQAFMAGLFRDGVERGVFHCADPEAAAWRVLALLDGMAIQTVAGQTRMPRDQLHDWVRTAARAEAGLPEVRTLVPRRSGPKS